MSEQRHTPELSGLCDRIRRQCEDGMPDSDDVLAMLDQSAAFRQAADGLRNAIRCDEDHEQGGRCDGPNGKRYRCDACAALAAYDAATKGAGT